MPCSLHGYLKPGRIEIALAGISETLDLITRASMQQLFAQQRPRLRSAIEERGSTYKLSLFTGTQNFHPGPCLTVTGPYMLCVAG